MKDSLLFQARWDLALQQESRGFVMAQSSASTTSSSNGGSSGSRRESFDPASSLSAAPPGGAGGFRDTGFRERQHRSSRSSADGDGDDSDPCASYPYLPLDQCPENQPAAAKPGRRQFGRTLPAIFYYF